MKRVALITGGSRGIGFGIAKHLATNGFDLAINGTRAADDVEDAVQELKDFGNDVIYCQGNISSSADRRKYIETGKRTLWQTSCAREQCRCCAKRTKRHS